MREYTHKVDLCVIGGGIAGLCAAVSAARHGIKVVLMQDRPVLGGNASSEVRMWICGAADKEYNRETGIVEELMLENYYRNHSLSFSIWDSVLYEKARFEPNITLLLNCSCTAAKTEDDTIIQVSGWQLTCETWHHVSAQYFADCSGDSILAELVGAPYMQGREARDMFDESIAPEKADKKTMGLSCLFQIRETDRPQKFVPPAWAYSYPDDSYLPHRSHSIKSNYWWIELGGDMDSIHDTEFLRDELLKIAFGVWDHMKNHGDHGVECWQLDWIGFLPGKRESRRYIGDYIINQNDVRAGGRFDDIVAYGGWPMDDHFPKGFYYTEGHPTIYHAAPSPWGIPFRSLYSRDIKNLLFAGRNISATHVALSSTRVMATCGVMGQAVGTAAALAVNSNTPLCKLDIHRLQQMLMLDDCYIPYTKRELSKLTKTACVNTEIIRNAKERGEENCYVGNNVSFEFDSKKHIQAVRLVFDSNLARDYNNMPCSFPLIEQKYKLPDTLVKSYQILADGEVVFEMTNNYQRLNMINLGISAKKIEIVFTETYNAQPARIFAVDLL